jgi:gamma-glutamylcyclotransferase (GGCT)/AIG2-like uncharacterized protein YtfP
MPDYLFAYGTLLPGAAPAEVAGIAARLKAVGEGCVRGRLYNLGHFPGAVLEETGNERSGGGKSSADRGADRVADQNKAGQMVYGTVFELPRGPAVLQALDAYEEFDPANPAASQFLRRRCVASLQSGAAIECWIYVYNRGVKNIPVVEGGRWNAGAISG